MATYPPAVAFKNFTGAPEVLVEAMAEGTNAQPATGQEPCPHSWGITEITVSKSGKSSRSFSERDHAPLAAGRSTDGRFYFAPSKDELTVTWKLHKADNAEQLKLELYRYGTGVPIWSRTLNTEDTKKLSFKWNGNFDGGVGTDGDAFPDGMLTAAHAPYMLKATAVGSAESGKVERWTYLDVLVHSLTLEWPAAPEKSIPAARADRAKHVDVCTRLKDASDDDNLNANLPTPGQTKKAYLKANVYYQGDSELTGENNSYFAKLHALWGDGAMIPVFVKATIRDAAGDSVDVPKALGKARLLWDYEDKSTANAPGGNSDINAYLRKLLEDDTDATADAPKGTNCPVGYGGKRGAGGAPVFPAQAGTDPVDTLPDAGDIAPSFPFKVVQCTGRKWAAVSEVWRTGALAGRSGVIFQPSRMAGDAYAMHVFFVLGGADDPVAEAVKGADDPDKVDAEIRVSSGTFAVWHSVDVAKYIQIGTGAGTVDVSAVQTMLAKQYMRLEYDPSKKVDGTNQFKAGMQKVYPGTGTLRARLANYVQDALPTTPATGGRQPLIQFKPYTDWRRAWVARFPSEAAANAQSLTMANPRTASGDEKYDWFTRGGDYPMKAGPPIDHTNAVNTQLQGKVVVEFTDPKQPDPRRYTVKFEDDKRITRDKNTALTVVDKIELAKLYQKCIELDDTSIPAYKTGDPSVVVTLKGKTTGTGNLERLTNIRAALDEIVRKFNSSDHRMDDFFPSNDGGELGGLSKAGFYYRKNCAYEWTWNIVELVLQDQFPSTSGGLYLLQVAGVEVCNFNGPKAKAMYAPADGKSLVIVLSPTAQAPTLAHEVGHAKFVNHTYGTQATNDPLKLHHKHGGFDTLCTMRATGVSATNTFCGICMLRMRGWSIFSVDDPIGGTFDDTTLQMRHDAL
jgi:hypothetical protein